MFNYIAFLRGINVSGKKVIKMENLNQIFISLGFVDIKTFIQSGNVVFSAKESDPNLLSEVIEENLFIKLGYKVTVLLRTKQEVENLIKQNPFKKYDNLGNVKYYVTFLRKKPVMLPELPIISPNKDIEVFKINNLDAFCISHFVKGRFGFPNNYVEKVLGIPATTRNWTTVCKVIK